MVRKRSPPIALTDSRTATSDAAYVNPPPSRAVRLVNAASTLDATGRPTGALARTGVASSVGLTNRGGRSAWISRKSRGRGTSGEGWVRAAIRLLIDHTLRAVTRA